ncbi:uncharacterized protein LOC126251371 [Schistocerca nitens]|uniref:uncharacterized protein LOC126251371 n=1 Tax=Schistocerca nitens TaxID=7011 RepID=UPI0021175F83|nr:uncharacterized protein LOC126251371 [Schistocerca nitens]
MNGGQKLKPVVSRRGAAPGQPPLLPTTAPASSFAIHFTFLPHLCQCESKPGPCPEPCGSPVAESEGEEEAGALTQTAAPAAPAGPAAPAATAPSMADHYDVEGQALGVGLGAGAAPAAPRPPPTANAVPVPSLIERPPEVDKKVKSVQPERGPPAVGRASLPGRPVCWRRPRPALATAVSPSTHRDRVLYPSQ